MEADRRDHVAAVRGRQDERAREIMPLVRLVSGAAPVMDALTNDPNWDRYLTYLQGILGSWTTARDGAREKLASPAVWSHEDLLKLKCDVLVADATIQAFQLAIDLPKAIMGGSEEAKRIIEEFEARNESAGQTKP